MRPTTQGLMATATVAVVAFFAYQKYQGTRELPQRSSATTGTPANPGKALATTPAASHQAASPSAASKSPAAESGRNQGSSRETHQEIDRLEAERTPEAVDSLLTYLDHPNNWVKARVLQALGTIGSPRALPQIVAMLDHKADLLAVRGAYMAIGNIGPKMTNPEDRQLAVSGLKKSMELYRNESDQESRSNVYVLIQSTGHIPGPESGEFLLAELPKFHQDPLAQYSIVKALGEIKFKAAADPLKRFRADLVNEGPAAWGDKAMYSDLLQATDESIALISAVSDR